MSCFKLLWVEYQKGQHMPKSTVQLAMASQVSFHRAMGFPGSWQLLARALPQILTSQNRRRECQRTQNYWDSEVLHRSPLSFLYFSLLGCWAILNQLGPHWDRELFAPNPQTEMSRIASQRVHEILRKKHQNCLPISKFFNSEQSWSQSVIRQNLALLYLWVNLIIPNSSFGLMGGLNWALNRVTEGTSSWTRNTDLTIFET